MSGNELADAIAYRNGYRDGKASDEAEIRLLRAIVHGHLRTIGELNAKIDLMTNEIRKLRRELADARGMYDVERSRRTMGGTPPMPDSNWANERLAPPPSASDDNMPAHRRIGLARSTDMAKDGDE